jgi:hypothetical protein
MSFAVRKIEDPMIPLTSSNTPSSRESPRIRLGCDSEDWFFGDAVAGSMIYPMPNSSGDSSGVPHRRQITALQSPHVNGSVTSCAQRGQ